MGDFGGDEETDPTGIDLATALTRKRACMTAITGSASGTVFKLPAARSLIGRATECTIRITDDGVSRKHAAIWSDGDTMWLADLESRNGTYLNGQRVTAATVLRDGDKIQVGRTTILRFGYHDDLDEAFHENLVSSALRDPLTRLFNKRYFLDRLASEVKFARRHETALSLLLIDIDHFKTVNDNHGHLAGDAVLVKLAEVLLRAVREEDVVARFGGEELAIILRAVPLDAAFQLSDRLRRLIEQTIIQHQDREIRATVSIGVAMFAGSERDTADMLIEAADQALYRAKNAGRNRVAR
ncbi:MAG: diguanylate cyclase [Kofleriaceae bacterium]